jgi:hypothetical protein
MKVDKDILSRINHRDGMTVPDGWFDDFATRMVNSLPERPELETAPQIIVNHSLWSRIRTYVYMAAMFAGIWCMLKMFTSITSNSSDVSMESNPILAEAFNNETFVNDYIMDDLNQWDVIDDMIEDGVDVDALVDSMMVVENANR